MTLDELMESREAQAGTSRNKTPSLEGWELGNDWGPCIVDKDGRLVCTLDYESAVFGKLLTEAPAMYRLLREIAKGEATREDAKRFFVRYDRTDR